jgi:hypothetical protein
VDVLGTVGVNGVQWHTVFCRQTPWRWQREGRRSEGDEPAEGAQGARAQPTERSRLPRAASAEGTERDDLVTRLHAKRDVSGGEDPPSVRCVGLFYTEGLGDGGGKAWRAERVRAAEWWAETESEVVRDKRKPHRSGSAIP